MEHEREEDFFVTAMHPIVDQRAILHHVVVGAIDRHQVPADFDYVEGADCINDDMGAIQGMIAAWAPGTQPVELDGGIRVGADQVLLVQLHYFQSGPDAVGLMDESGYAFRTAPAVERELEVMELGSFTFRIPAGDPAYSFTETYRPPAGLRIHGVFPHMHVLGSAYRMWVGEGRDEDCVVDADRYDFDNQLFYMFDEPVEVEPGEDVSWTCTWNNSTTNPDRIHDEPRETLFGEGTDEEMCFFFSIVEVP